MDAMLKADNMRDDIRVKIPLEPMDRAALAGQQLAAPVGHLIVGPARFPPFFACATCGVRWSNGTHPANVANRQILEAAGADPPRPYWDY